MPTLGTRLRIGFHTVFFDVLLGVLKSEVLHTKLGTNIKLILSQHGDPDNAHINTHINMYHLNMIKSNVDE